MTLYSNSRLIVYDDQFKLQPDILESYEAKDNREFTLKLRAGHKWSDGKPFTTEDFRFFWEDIANNSDLSPRGPSVELLVDGKPPKVEIIDELTIRYSWDKPNPYFIESQARAAPLFLFRPAHYLKTLHGKYTPEEEILKAHIGSRWANVFRRQDAMYGNDNVGPADAQCLEARDDHRRRSASCSSAIPSTTGSTKRACSCPTSTRSSSRWSRPT